MLRIALCDDEKDFLAWFKRKIVKELELLKMPEALIDQYCDGTVFLDEQKSNPYDVLFLDINMPEINGIELAEKLREAECIPMLIFTTGRDDLVFPSFSVHPYSFLRKRYINEELPKLLFDVMRDYNKDAQTVTFKCREGIVAVRLLDIYYIESAKNDIIFYTKDRSYTVRDSLSAKEKELCAYGFFRTHAGFIVNINHVFMVEKMYLILDDGRRVPVSRNRLKGVKNEILKNTTKLE